MLSRVPFVSFALFFIAGIVLSEHCLSASFVSLSGITWLLVLTGIAAFYFYHRKADFFSGIFISLFLVFAGSQAYLLQNSALITDEKTLVNSNYSGYEATIKTLPEKRPKTIRTEALITRICTDSTWTKVKLKVLISFPVDAPVIPQPGDCIIVKGKLDRAAKALNPQEFDYRQYLWNKGIVWTDYLNYNAYYLVPANKRSFNPGLWSLQISEWADRKFRENIKNDRSYGLVKAMLLGRRDDLRSDQVDDYTTSGTVHILSVSGMHVAILFLVISMALKWMKRWHYGKYIYLVTVTALLCFYALITGLPPSVQRATFMCILFVVADAFMRKQNSMNTLAIAALLILVSDPNALYDVGFQLSFLAMSGIFLLYEPLERIWKPANPVLKYVWQITALSFAAQLATFPLSLYYFHQFPFYFWLVNPFVIGFTNFLLPAALVLLFVSLFNFPDIQFIANWWVEASAYLTNVSVAVPKLLPGYLIENLYLDKAEVILLYSFIFAVWYSYFTQEYVFLRRAAALAMLFVFYSVSTNIQTYFSSTAMIHAVPRHSVISFKEGSCLYISSDTAFQADTDSYKFHMKNYAVSQGITQIIYLNKSQKLSGKNLIVRELNNGRLLSWHGILLFHGEYIQVPAPVDYALISGGKILKNSNAAFDKKTTLLLGGEFRSMKREKWNTYFAEMNRPVYDLSNGALLLH